MMTYPKQIEVLVEGDDKEVKAIRLHVSARYDAAEYEDTTGRKFFIDRQYMEECQFGKKLIRIPLQVITKNEQMRARLEQAMAAQRKLAKKQETGLVLPDDYKEDAKTKPV